MPSTKLRCLLAGLSSKKYKPSKIKNVAIETDITEQLTALIQRQTVVYSVEYIAPVLLYWPESQSAQSLKLESYEVVKVSPHQFDLQNHPLSISLPAWALI